MQSEKLISTIHQRLRERGWMCAVAESLTGGRVQSLLTSVSGASDVFAGGMTVYTIDQKVALLNVDRDEAVACNAVSESIASAMVRGVCTKFGCDCGVATTGYAEPYESVATPFGWVAVSLDGVVSTRRITATGTRTVVQQEIADGAVDFLNEVIG